MDRNMRAMAWSMAISATLGLGCSLVKPEADRDAGLGLLAGGGDGSAAGDPMGGLVAPTRIALKVMIATRPIDEPALREAVWGVADEHVIAPEQRQRLEANGLRVGVVDGTMPPEVEQLLSPEAPQGKRIDPTVIAVPDGHATPILVGPDAPADRMTLFLSLNGGAVGRDYEQARGALRVTASEDEGDGLGGVSLRVVPEIHHGSEQMRYRPAENLGPFEPEQFVMHEGQAEESFRDLSATLDLAPGQVLVLGCWPDRAGSLGHFLFTKPEPKSDRLLQSVVFLWAAPTGPTELPWVEPVSPPSTLREVDPSELGVEE